MNQSHEEHLKQLLDALETSLVKVFRLCQSLFVLVKDERQILVEGRANDLEGVSVQKQKILEEMENADQTRQKITGQIARICGLSQPIETLSDLLSNLEFERKEEIRRLQQGILTLQTDIRELNNGNYALATLNLQHLESVQGFLVNMIYSPSSYYGPTHAPKPVDPPSTWGMDHKA
jgi:flagellar biosynthesis/type III secretory pathway chaperone